MAIEFKPPVLSRLHIPSLHPDIAVYMLRLDDIHPEISGNKWFKLKENIRQAQALQHSTLLTFGGAWSNHLIATAAAAWHLKLNSIGIVRGLHGQQQPSPTLQHCREYGMQLHFVSREAYTRKTDPEYLRDLQKTFGQCYIIPEGGNNAVGMEGAADITAYIPADTNLVTVAVGSGATCCGLRNGLPKSTTLLGFPVMKNGTYLWESMKTHIHPEQTSWKLNSDYHFGGFARYDHSLIAFMNDFFREYQIPLDRIYTAKMMAGVFDLLNKNQVKAPAKIVCIHTGGLQGNDSIRDKLIY